MRKIREDSWAVSEVIGAVLMVGLVVVGAGVVGAVYFSQPAPKAMPHLSFNVEYNDAEHVAVLHHSAGDTLLKDEYNLYIIDSTGQHLVDRNQYPSCWSFGQAFPPISTPEKPGTILLTYLDGSGETALHRVVFNEEIGSGPEPSADDWSISGYKRNLADGSGLAGWTFDLSVPQGSVWNVIDTDVSDSDGYYRFEGLTAGTFYRVRERSQAGWIQASPNPSVIVLDSMNRRASNVNFTNQNQPSHEAVDWSISGYKIDAETGAGIPGWTMVLYYKGPGGAMIQQATKPTDSTGYYIFPNLDSDQYLVREVMQDGWHQVSTDPGEIKINGGHKSITGVNFTNARDVVQPLNGQVSGQVWSDDDGDGIWDAELEPLVGNWMIHLTPLDGSDILTTQTDETGHYIFSGVPAGAYVLSEESLPGWAQTYPSPPGTHSVTIDATNFVHPEKNFGNLNTIPPVDGAISGLKYNDLNGDGDRDAGEPALQGWEIVLYTQVSPLIELRRMVTNETGQYQFSNLPAGTYYVGEIQKSGWNQTSPNSPGAPEAVRNLHIPVVDASMSVHPNLDFGNHVYVPPPTPTPAPTPQEWEGEVVHLIKLAGGNGKLVDGTYFQCETSKNDYVIIDGTRHSFNKDQVRFIINGNQTQGRFTITHFNLIEFSFDVIMQEYEGNSWVEKDRGMISKISITQINKNGISADSTLRYELTSVSADTTLDINGVNVIDSPDDASSLDLKNCHIVHDNRYHEGNNVMYLHLEPNQNSLLVQCDTILSPPPA